VIFGVGAQNPTEMTITIQPEKPNSKRIYYRSETRYQDGRKSVSEYTNGYDGTSVVVLTDGRINAPVSLTRKNDRDVIATYFRGNKSLAVSERIVSEDGKTMSVTTTSSSADGTEVQSRLIFERQD
jgi:hypothetical protein